MDHRHSPNIIILRFPALAGGKFLGAMLSYFDSFFYPVPMVTIYPFVEHLSNEELKSYGHIYAMATVPPMELRHNWAFYESRFGHFWGYTPLHVFPAVPWDLKSGELKKEELEQLAPNRSKDIIKSYKSASMLIHECSYDEASLVFPNAKIINLIDYNLLQRISMRFKLHHTNSFRDTTPISGPNVINFSMQNVFSKSRFIDDVSALAFTLSGNSNYDPRMEEYYDKYKAVHL
jgi:hypothetical protein